MSREFHQRVSLALNVILAVAAVALIFPRSEPAAMSAVEERPVGTVNAPPSSVKPGLPQYPDAASPQDQRRWLVDQLRAMGVPNKVLARLVWADLDWKWNQRGGELSLKCHGDPDTMAANKLENAMSLDAEMRAALGEEGFKQWDHENMLREANQGKIELTPAETDSAYDLWKKVRQRELELRQAKIKGEMDEADSNDALEKEISEFNQQMKSLLGNERYAKSQQMDDGTSAASLRQNFAKANPSDSQFQELLKTQQQWNERRSELDKQFQDDQSSAAYLDKLKSLDDTREQEYRRVLGDAVFDTLQKEQDFGYNRMKKYADIWGLNDESIDSVYGAMKYYQKNVEDYRARARTLETEGQDVDWDAVNKNIQQFDQETQQALQNYLGKDRFAKMKQNGVFQSGPLEFTRHSAPSQ
jgi:hypothetical protein